MIEPIESGTQLERCRQPQPSALVQMQLVDKSSTAASATSASGNVFYLTHK